jgi:hypothetical protein
MCMKLLHGGGGRGGGGGGGAAGGAGNGGPGNLDPAVEAEMARQLAEMQREMNEEQPMSVAELLTANPEVRGGTRGRGSSGAHRESRRQCGVP